MFLEHWPVVFLRRSFEPFADVVGEKSCTLYDDNAGIDELLTCGCGFFCLCHQGVASYLDPDLVYGFAGVVDDICTCVAFLVQCGWSDFSIVCVKEREDERWLFVDLACDGVHDDCKPFSVVGG